MSLGIEVSGWELQSGGMSGPRRARTRENYKPQVHKHSNARRIMIGFDATLIYEGKQRDRFGEEQTDFTRTLTREEDIDRTH